MNDLKDFLSFQAEENKVELQKLGGKVLTLNPISLADDAWLEANITPEDRVAAFKPNTLNEKIILRIFYRLLTIESKEIISSIQLYDIDEDGNKTTIEAKGPEKLLHLVSGAREIIVLMAAIGKARGISSPVVNEALKAEKTEGGKSLAGPNSSTSLPVNTDIQSKNFLD